MIRFLKRMREIYRLKRAIIYTEIELDRMESATKSYDCCTACKFGSVYSELIEKHERQKNWLKILKQKK